MNVIWSIKDLKEIAEKRQHNKFDFNICVSGARGNGKSTFLYKFYSRFPIFRPKIHLVYSRHDVMTLLEKSKFTTILDDEAIRSQNLAKPDKLHQQPLGTAIITPGIPKLT